MGRYDELTLTKENGSVHLNYKSRFDQAQYEFIGDTFPTIDFRKAIHSLTPEHPTQLQGEQGFLSLRESNDQQINFTFRQKNRSLDGECNLSQLQI